MAILNSRDESADAHRSRDRGARRRRSSSLRRRDPSVREARRPSRAFARGTRRNPSSMKRFAGEIREDVLEHAPARCARFGCRGEKAGRARPAPHRGPHLGSAGPDPLHGAAGPEARRSIPATTRASRSRTSRRADRGGSERGRRSPARGDTPSSTPSRDARRRRAISRSRTSPGTFVEILAPGQSPRTFRDEKLTLEVGHADSMPEINEALRGALPGETQPFPQDVSGRFLQRGVPGQDGGLRADARGSQGKEAAFARRRVRERGRRGRDGGEPPRAKVRRGPAREKEAERRRKFRRQILDVLLSRVRRSRPGGAGRVGARTPRCATTRGTSASNGIDPQGGGLGEAPGGRAPGSRAARAGVPAARRDRAPRGHRGHARRSSRPSSSGPRPAAASSRPPCGSRWRRPTASRRCATRCGSRGPSTCLISAARVLPSGEPRWR